MGPNGAPHQVGATRLVFAAAFLRWHGAGTWGTHWTCVGWGDCWVIGRMMEAVGIGERDRIRQYCKLSSSIGPLTSPPSSNLFPSLSDIMFLVPLLPLWHCSWSCLPLLDSGILRALSLLVSRPLLSSALLDSITSWVCTFVQPSLCTQASWCLTARYVCVCLQQPLLRHRVR